MQIFRDNVAEVSNCEHLKLYPEVQTDNTWRRPSIFINLWSNHTSKSELFSLIIVAARCEQHIGLPENPPGSDFLLSLNHYTTKKSIECLICAYSLLHK